MVGPNPNRKASWMINDEIQVELTEDVKRIGVYFRYDEVDVGLVKSVKGRRFHGDENPKYWSVPRDIKSARALREVFGQRMKLGPAMRMWAREQVNMERNLRSLSVATDAELLHIPEVIEAVIAGRPIDHPSIPRQHVLRREREPRPYQRADIKMMGMSNAINANDVGIGKTLEAIGAVYEAEVDTMPVLVIAPKRTLVSVWQTEFDRLTDFTIYTSESPRERLIYLEQFPTLAMDDNVGLALIADDIRLEKYHDVKNEPPEQEDSLHACRDYRGNWYRFRSEAQRALFNISWGAFIIDEFHTTGLPNRKSLFAVSASQIVTQRKWPMSGTPIGGKARRLWPILNFIDPVMYSSEWRWIEDWLVVTEDKVYVRGGRGATRTVRNVGDIDPAKEDAFYEHHRMHMIRRIKKDALPGLPDALEIVVETPMEGRQLKEYKQFDEDHEIILEGGKRLSGSIVLSQYTRLRQMANARLEFRKGKTKPDSTLDSCKLDYLLERLDENGIRKTDYEPGARAYVGVLDKSFMFVVEHFLAMNGIICDTLSGITKTSTPILNKFSGDMEAPYVIVMTIQTGGTGLNLERANSAHMLDEPWDPDVSHQFFGRGDRGARDAALRCYTYRTPDSIQEYVAEVAGDKKITNNNVLEYARAIEEMRKK